VETVRDNASCGFNSLQLSGLDSLSWSYKTQGGEAETQSADWRARIPVAAKPTSRIPRFRGSKTSLPLFIFLPRCHFPKKVRI